MAFCGLEILESGKLVACKTASTLTEAEQRAENLKENLERRAIHPNIIKFCKAELLQENYFHAVLEAVKSVFSKLRNLSGYDGDGEKLANKCFAGKSPKLLINHFKTSSEKMEQSGFNELIKGIYSMFRNPISHEARINWPINKQDAEDLLTTLSMIHRRIDTSAAGHGKPKAEARSPQ
ncbi:MAG: TIGR02391 family protein [Gammaproteobacteria bacterium]|nr:TIGR02391 family protein [Gammaproteobacteria bacterium]